MLVWWVLQKAEISHFIPSSPLPFLAENSSPGHLIFFLTPVGIQISINVGLFIVTAIHCNRVKSEIHRMQMNDNCDQKKKRYIADKAMWVGVGVHFNLSHDNFVLPIRFLMNLKLFTVMGISWFWKSWQQCTTTSPGGTCLTASISFKASSSSSFSCLSEKCSWHSETPR